MSGKMPRATVCALSVLLIAGYAGAANYREEAEVIAGEIATIHPRGSAIAESDRFQTARKALLGGRVVAVNGGPIEDVVRRFGQTMAADNPAWPANWAPQALPPAASGRPPSW